MAKFLKTLALSFTGMSTFVSYLANWSIFAAPSIGKVESLTEVVSKASVVIESSSGISIDAETNSTLFPNRLISVFGLEKSGTTWTSLTIAKALGIVPETTRILTYSAKSRDGTIQVQHTSKPWGKFPTQSVKLSCNPKNLNQTKTIFAAVPLKCAKHSMLAKKRANAILPEECKRQAHLDDFVQISSRFFVNITSHIQWYLEHGVDATAVILMRDNTIAHISKTNTICTNAEVSRQQNEYANDITRQAIQQLPPSRIVLVSFEGLVSLGMPYLLDVYRRLDINSAYMPDFKDANKKYIRTELIQG